MADSLINLPENDGEKDGHLMHAPQEMKPIRPSMEQARPRVSLDVAGQFQEMKLRTSISIERKSLQLDREKVVVSKELAKQEVPTGSQEYQAEEHMLSLEVLANRLGTDINFVNPKKSGGLTSSEANTRLERNGKNRLTPPKKESEIIKYLKYYLNFFMILLEVAAVLCFIAYGLDRAQEMNLYVACILLGIVILNCTMSYWQDRKSGQVMDSFKNMLPQKCKVIRDGHESQILAEDLVFGDVVIVSGGDKVPADIRVIQCDGLKVDNSSLTGESDPQPRSVDTKEENPLEAHNLIFYGTLALDGSARGVVYRTGDNTLIGSIARLTQSNKTNKLTTLQREVNRFVIFISILALVMGAIFFIIGIIRKHGSAGDVITTLVNTIGIIVANVPEGLPATVTACLTIAGKNLAAKNIWVKKLESVETLGCVTLIASDKTGTLTQNRMTAVHVWYDGSIASVKDNDIINKYDINAPSFSNLLRVATLCSRAEFDHNEVLQNIPIDKRTVYGDASETAILRLCEGIHSVEKARDLNPKLFEIPFNSANKYQISIHTVGKGRLLAIKGAPEIIFGRCSHFMSGGEVLPMNPQFEATFQDACIKLAGMGERVLGFAQTNLEADPNVVYTAENGTVPLTGLTFVGLIALIDPPREGVANAIGKCHTAGIKVVMVTGDHPLTAQAIAKQIGIITLPTASDLAKERGCEPHQVPEEEIKAVVVTGGELRTMTEDQWERIIHKEEIVFARTSPQQKLQIVEHFQGIGHCVAVTGDGVNDSPALKQADIGVAMGITGSDVAKETAGVILTDDNFCSIVNGIEEGRIIFDNLKKSIAYQLSHLFPEVLPFALNVFIQLPLGLSAVLILVIDLGTEIMPAISLAYEEAEADIMRRKPRNVKTDHLVSFPSLFYAYLQAGIIEAAGAFVVYYFILHSYGLELSELVSTPDYFVTGAQPFLTRSGIIYTEQQQLEILAQAQAGFFLGIVMIQIANIICCKTRTRSLFQHGLRNNVVLMAIFVEASIVVLLVFTPGLQTVFGTSPPIPGYAWLIPLPFMAFLFGYVELRKAWARKYKTGFIARYFQW